MSGKNPKIGVAIVGGGQGCLELLQLLEHFRLEEFQVQVIGVADVRMDAPGVVYARNRGLMTTTDITQFYSHPGIELIIELTGDDTIVDYISRTKPARMRLIDHFGAQHFWDLMKLKTEKRAHSILESTRDAFVLVNASGIITQCNKAAKQMFAYQCHLFPGEPVGKFVRRVFGLKGLSMLAQQREAVYNLTAHQGTEREFPAEVCLFRAEIEEENCLVISVRDVSERWQAQQEISRLHAYELLYNNVATQFVLSQDVEESIKYTVQVIGENLGADRVALWYISSDGQDLVLKAEWHVPELNRQDYSCTISIEKLPFLWENIRATKVVKSYSIDILPEPDRTTLGNMGIKSLLVVPVINEEKAQGALFLENHCKKSFWSNEKIGVLSTMVTIMGNAIQKEEARKRLQESEALYQAMVDKSLTGIYIVQNGLLRAANDRMAEIFGYTPKEMINLTPVSLAHPDDRQLVAKHLGNLQINELVNTSYNFRGITKDGQVVWLECRDTRVMINGYPAVIGNMMDVTERIRHEQTRNMMFEAITMVAVGMVEQRDPYTAGHQRKVAEIATAIGRQMGLSAFELEGLRLAALLHDVGKFAVPIEILTKPGRLRPSEFHFIKLHSQVGAEILAEVPFAWDISSVVLQHHERLNGSGYPAHLQGDEISMGARIIAVADVLEAMSSHRPYRPSLGLEAALQELIQNQGRLYDTEVVAALCR